MSLTHADYTLAAHANALAAHHDSWEDVAKAYASLSEPLFIAGLALLCLAGLVLRRPRLLVPGIIAGGATALALIVGSVVSSLVNRPRPFVAHHDIHAFLRHAPDPGFPSDHATAAFAIATVLVMSFGARAVPVLLAAIALAVSRVLIGIHYPGDVLAGALIGTMCAALSVAVARSRVAGPLLERLPGLRAGVGT